MNLTYSFPSVFQMLWHSINPCFDIQHWTSGTTAWHDILNQCLPGGLCCGAGAGEAEIILGAEVVIINFINIY